MINLNEGDRGVCVKGTQVTAVELIAGLGSGFTAGQFVSYDGLRRRRREHLLLRPHLG